MRRVAVFALAATFFATAPSLAQQQPYGGLQARPVKALSDEQIADLKAGRGMSLALAAELNGYPGPAHVVELADELHLSAAQRAKARELFAAMKAEAVPLGQRLITQEQHLDSLFASNTATPTSLGAATAAIGTTQGKLRGAHLKYHLAMIAELTPEQVARYRALRGYANTSAPPHGHGHAAPK
jgi:Spy/CpxP family protein refolding chaperone